MGKRKSTNEPDNVYIVETITKKKLRNNKEPLYLIKWKDWDDKYNTWEPTSNILDKSLIEQFEEEELERRHQEAAKEEPETAIPCSNHNLLNGKSSNLFENLTEQFSSKLDKEECQIKDSVEKDIERPKICLKISKQRISQSAEDNLTVSKQKEQHQPSFNYKIESKQTQNEHTSSTHKKKKLLSINEYAAIIKQKHITPANNSYLQERQKLYCDPKENSSMKHKKKKKKKQKFHDFTESNSTKDKSPQETIPKNQPLKVVTCSPASSLSLPSTQMHKSSPSSPTIIDNTPTHTLTTHKTLQQSANPSNWIVVTDVCVNGLNLCFKEFLLDDDNDLFQLNDSANQRFHQIKIQKSSDWFQRIMANSANENQPIKTNIANTKNEGEDQEEDQDSDIDVVGGFDEDDKMESSVKMSYISESEEEQEREEEEQELEEDSNNNNIYQKLPELKPAPWVNFSGMSYEIGDEDDDPIDLSLK